MNKKVKRIIKKYRNKLKMTQEDLDYEYKKKNKA